MGDVTPEIMDSEFLILNFGCLMLSSIPTQMWPRATGGRGLRRDRARELEFPLQQSPVDDGLKRSTNHGPR